MKRQRGGYPGRSAVVLMVVLTSSGCTEPPDPSPGPPPGSPSTGTVEVLRRPWAHPDVTGDTCPVTATTQQPDPGLGPLLGDGPARPAGIGAGAVLAYDAPSERTDWQDRTWGGQKVLWAVDPAVRGPVLVRGRRLDAAGDVGFEDPAKPELLLNVTPYEGQSGGWKDYPSFTRLRAPGCYAYQVDTVEGTWSIVFVAQGPVI